VCIKAKVLQFFSHPLDEQHRETSLSVIPWKEGVCSPNIAHHCAAMWRRRKNEEPSLIRSQEFRDKFRNIPGEVFESYATF
jgi:hypothetical protein